MKIQPHAYSVTNRLYGKIYFDSEEKELMGPLHYLHDLSLSSVPNSLLPIGQTESRFNHSLGALHLMKTALANSTDFREYARELRFAALLHDSGHPCFSHLSEPFLEMVSGFNHETYLLERLDRQRITKVLEKLQVDPQLLYQLVNGQKQPFSSILNGSLDVDNLDNVPNYLVSSGLDPHARSFETLAKRFSLQDNTLVLQDNDNQTEKLVLEWLKQRRILYTFLTSPENMAPGVMLYRAMEFAYGHESLGLKFFHLSDEGALNYLERSCGQEARLLVQQAKQLNIYRQVFTYSTEQPNQRVREATLNNLARFTYRHDLADWLSAEFGIARTDIAVYVGKDRGVRKINIPLCKADGSLVEINQPDSDSVWNIQVYINPKVDVQNERIKQQMMLEVGEHSSRAV